MAKTKEVKVGNFFTISNDRRFALMAGPCQLETADHALMIADKIQNICTKLGINYIFKSSFDKANRTSIKSKRGVSIDEGTKIFEQVRKKIGCPIVTDFHLNEQFHHPIIDQIDVIQIPAFLCRQTDLLKGAAETGKVVEVKKGQFLSPQETKYIWEKLESFGNEKIILMDRGTSFGYNALVNDMTCYPIMAENGHAVGCDCTHSVQRPGAGNGCTIGNREMAEVIAKAAVAVGISTLFAEVHQDPDNAPCDGPNMIRLDQLERILKILVAIDDVVKNGGGKTEIKKVAKKK